MNLKYKKNKIEFLTNEWSNFLNLLFSSNPSRESLNLINWWIVKIWESLEDLHVAKIVQIWEMGLYHSWSQEVYYSRHRIIQSWWWPRRSDNAKTRIIESDFFENFIFHEILKVLPDKRKLIFYRWNLRDEESIY